MTQLHEAPPTRAERSTRVPAVLRDSGSREAVPTPGLRPEQLLLLQRQAGNAAVAELLRPDTDEEEAQEVQEVETPERELEESDADSSPPADGGGDEPEAPPSDTGDAPSRSAPAAPPSDPSETASGSSPEAPTPDAGETASGSAAEAPAPDASPSDGGETSSSGGSRSPQPGAASAPTDESEVEQALAAHDPKLAGEGTETGAEEPTLAPEERTDDPEPAVSAPSLAGLQPQQSEALAAISQSERSLEGRASALTVQVGEAAGAARRQLMKAYVSSLASLAGLRIEARTAASTAGIEAEADLRARRKRQKAASTAAKIVATVTLDGRLGASRGKVNDYLASRLDSSGQRGAAQRQHLKSVRDAAIRGWAGSSKPKEIRRLAEKAYSRLLGQSLDAILKIRLDLRKKAMTLKAEISGVRSESIAQFTKAGLEVDKGIDGVGVDSTKGLIAGATPFLAKGSEAQGEVDKLTAAAADHGMKAGLVPALADVDELRRASLAAIGPVRRSAAKMFGSLRAGVKQRFALVMSVVAGVRGRRRTAEALQAAQDFGGQIVAGAGQGARSVVGRFTGWAARLVEAPAQIVEKADFGLLVEGTRMLLAKHIAEVKKRFVKSVDDLEVLMASLVAKGAIALGSIAEKAGDATLARVGEELGKLEEKFGPALDGLERTAAGFKPRLSKAVIALWDAWYEKAWSYLKGGLSGLLKAMWNFVKGLALVIVGVVVLVILVVVVLVVGFGMAIGAAVIAVGAAVATALAWTIVAVGLAALAVYGVYKAIEGGYKRWKGVTDDPLSTREEIGSAAGEGVGDIAAEFIPIKLPKPLARFSKKVANRLRKVETLPGGRHLDDFGSGPRNADGASKLDEVDEVGSSGAKADERDADWSTVLDDIDEAGSGAGKADALDEVGSRAGKADAVDELDELDPGAGKADAVEAAPAPAPKAADDGRLRDLVGKDVAPDELARRTGIAQKDFDELARYADQRGLEMSVRPANVATPGQLSRGAIPKDMLIKAKSVGKVDVDYLGARAGTEGLAAVFKPKKPSWRAMRKIKKTNPELAQEITKGYKARKAAYKNRKADWADYTNGVDDQPPLIQIDPDTGVIRGFDPGSGKYKDFVSDYDLYDLRMKDGSPLTPEMYALVVADLQHMGLAQHGAHMNMKFDVGTAKFEDPATQAMWEGIRDSHQPGPKGEPVVVFGDGAPRADWPPPPAPKAPSAGDSFHRVVTAGRRGKDIIDGDPDDDAQR